MDLCVSQPWPWLPGAGTGMGLSWQCDNRGGQGGDTPGSAPGWGRVLLPAFPRGGGHKGDVGVKTLLRRREKPLGL